MIEIDAYDGSDSSFTFAASYHENISFDTVKFKYVTAAKIDRLKNSIFNNVTITNYSGTMWAVTNSSGLTFTNVTPAP
ncbi:MAG: hypothetical protein QM776_07210 [Rhodocyclaceae bacterium]